MPKKSLSYQHHKGSGQAKVRVDGKVICLGPFGSPESREKYESLLGAWYARRGDMSRHTLSNEDLAILYLRFSERYYCRKNGKPTGTTRNVRDALRPLIKVFGASQVREFGPRKLKAVREDLIEARLCRSNINRRIPWIKRVFKWGVETEDVPAPIHTAQATASRMKSGWTEAVESDPVQPVDEGTVTATCPHFPTGVSAMVKLQLLNGARPTEIKTNKLQAYGFLDLEFFKLKILAIHRSNFAFVG